MKKSLQTIKLLILYAETPVSFLDSQTSHQHLFAIIKNCTMHIFALNKIHFHVCIQNTYFFKVIPFLLSKVIKLHIITQTNYTFVHRPSSLKRSFFGQKKRTKRETCEENFTIH